MEVANLVHACHLSPFKFDELLGNMEKAVRKLIIDNQDDGKGDVALQLLHFMEQLDEHVSGTLANFEMEMLDMDKFTSMFLQNDRISWARELLELAGKNPA